MRETGINVLVPEAQALVFLLRHFLKTGLFHLDWFMRASSTLTDANGLAWA